ncbi:trypsin-like serine peptidase [Streptomyces sp. NPDC049879]|uniref:trypsin-like serine peptidase n=1 Tax=Streptomyces sp. NPDC049879 TaxID=3365598 RepID=UPI0037993B48
MSSIRRRSRRRAALAATSLAACLALTATACGGDDEGNGLAQPSGETSAADDPEQGADGGSGDELQDLIDNLPFDFDLQAWLDGGWENWDSDNWLRDIGEFVNPIIEGLWDTERMGEAEDPGQSIDEGEIEEDPNPETPAENDPMGDRGVTDPEPSAIEAEAVPMPYTENGAPVGKVFFDSPDGPMVCSGTVIQDPAHPGQSNLVATAGHCVHAGAGGGWYRNIQFIPAFNNGGLPADQVYSESVAYEQVAPYGAFWADYVSTTQYWIDNGTESGGDGAHGDFAVMSVQPMEDTGLSLEETVGAAVPVNFDAPAVSGLGTVTLYGFPEAAPYDGVAMYRCTAEPGRLSLDASMPVMYWAGCTMTSGASGGPWLRTNGDGQAELVSVNSIGPMESTWLAGPRLDDEAQGVLEHVSAQVG